MRGLAGGMLSLLLLAACAPAVPPPDPKDGALLAVYDGESNETLWKRQATTEDTRELMMVEAVLGTRGQLSDPNGRYLGSRTAAGVGVQTYPRQAPLSHDVQCSDFPNAAAAQRAFLAAGGPARDPYGLDGDGDGSACAWGPQILTVANRYQGKGGATRALAPVGFVRAGQTTPVPAGTPTR